MSDYDQKPKQEVDLGGMLVALMFATVVLVLLPIAICVFIIKQIGFMPFVLVVGMIWISGLVAKWRGTQND